MGLDLAAALALAGLGLGLGVVALGLALATRSLAASRLAFSSALRLSASSFFLARAAAFSSALTRFSSSRLSRAAALAWAFLLALCGLGLIVLLQLRWQAQLVALGSLALVAAYPFMKRITGFPQAWLGLVFTWGVPVGWIAVSEWNLGTMAALYGGAVLWCVGYDTIYACQDREDDAMVGIRSSALAMGARVRAGIAAFYAAAIGLWALAFWLYRTELLALLALLPVAGHLAWQVATLDADDPMNPLARFRSNRLAGALMAAACFVVGNA